MEMNQELLAKAKKEKTPEELLSLAKESHTEMTEESAKAYFAILHPQTGEMADEELDNISGGACHNGDGKLVVSGMHHCPEWRCKKDGAQGNTDRTWTYCRTCDCLAACNTCAFCTYEKGLWLCNLAKNLV